MTRDEEPGRDELRVLLEEIAATAGDPPEHGLARVAMMRRRRTRHRRGAVATAVALAVCGGAGGLWLTGLGDREHDVSVAADTDGDGAQAATLPDRLSVRCSDDGIEVPVASIRPRDDGLHIEFENATERALDVWVTSPAWDSGDVAVEPGDTFLRQPVPPGVLTVGCRIGDRDEQRRVDLVDEEGLYREPELACDRADRTAVDDIELDEVRSSWSGAVRDALEEHLVEGDVVKAVDGYPRQRFGDPTTDPVARVVRDDDTVALVHLVPGEADGTWIRLEQVEVCATFLTGADDESGPATTAGTGGGRDAGEAAAVVMPA